MTSSIVNVIFSKYISSLTHNSKILAHGPKVNNLFTYVASSATPEPPTSANYSTEPSDLSLWHHRLTHTSYSTLETMKRLNSATGFTPKSQHGPNAQCQDCPYGKQTRLPFQKTEDLPTNIGDVVVSDVCGPFEQSIGGYKHFITWTDLNTRYTSIDFLKNKECSTITDSFKRYMAWMLRQKNTNVKRVQTDNGGEYTGKEFVHTCSKLGIIHKTTAPYTPEHNGIAKRHNRMLQEGALTL